MRKVFIPILALLVLSLITPVLAAPASKIPVEGSFIGHGTDPGESWITEDGILHVKDAMGAGPLICNVLVGLMEFTLSGAIDLNTGEGSMHGKWRFSDAAGTFEGPWRTENTGVIYYEGAAVGKGTGAYEGMVWRVDSFWGHNLYLINYPDHYGVYFDFEGELLCPKGVSLPPLPAERFFWDVYLPVPPIMPFEMESDLWWANLDWIVDSEDLYVREWVVGDKYFFLRGVRDTYLDGVDGTYVLEMVVAWESPIEWIPGETSIAGAMIIHTGTGCFTDMMAIASVSVEIALDDTYGLILIQHQEGYILNSPSPP